MDYGLRCGLRIAPDWPHKTDCRITDCNTSRLNLELLRCFIRRDDPVDLDMPVFPHLYIEYVVGQTIEHYVEQSRVKAPTRTISRRMFSDIAVEIGIAFSIGRQRSELEPMFTRRQILRLRDVVVEKCNEVTYGIRAVDTIPADDVIFIRPMRQAVSIALA